MKQFDQIIYTDDDAEDADLFEQALKETSDQVRFHYFESGNQMFEFLSKVKSHSKNLLFIDLNMPLKDGLQCIKEIRQAEQFKKLPVIVYSTSGHRQDIDKSYAAGANLFIKKPDSFNGIRETLKKIFELEWDNYFPKPAYSDFYLK